MGILHDIYRFYDPSQTAILFRGTLIPAFLTLFAWITRRGCATSSADGRGPNGRASGSRLGRDLELLLAGPAPVAARGLLGVLLVRDVHGAVRSGRSSRSKPMAASTTVPPTLAMGAPPAMPRCSARRVTPTCTVSTACTPV